MACRCEDMEDLSNKISKLKAVLEKCSLFNEKNVNAVEQLGYAKENSWRATKSACVQADVEIMPEMTDLIVNSKKLVVEEIGRVIGELESLYTEYKNEDEEAHP